MGKLIEETVAGIIYFTVGVVVAGVTVTTLLFVGSPSSYDQAKAVHRCEIAGQERGCLKHSSRTGQHDACLCIVQNKGVLRYEP